MTWKAREGKGAKKKGQKMYQGDSTSHGQDGDDLCCRGGMAVSGLNYVSSKVPINPPQ
jgi:hypothetical protein